ncbi:SAF domain-containing protein [Hydrogenimonas sp.]
MIKIIEEVFTKKNLHSIRPGHGQLLKHPADIPGKRYRKNFPKGTPLNWSLIE